ncbi:MAG: hypothetical protein IJB79_07040 [Candidatus Gastranaerophilales bacterium]|nr:hypothetical protein [Candidatus Gastranaerophilales bacterium]
MNLTISPINFKPFQKRIIKKENNQNNNINFDRQLISKNEAIALKNQILFTGDNSSRKKFLKQELNEYGVVLKSQTIEYITNPNNFFDERFAQYEKRGIELYKPYLYQALKEKFPEKYEEELEQIAQELDSRNNGARILTTLFDENLLSEKGVTLSNDAKSREFFALLGALACVSDKEQENLGAFMNKHVLPLIIPEDIKVKNNPFEKLKKATDKLGLNWGDVYVETIMLKDRKTYSVYYKNVIIARKIDRYNSKTAREECIERAIAALKNDQSILKSAKGTSRFDIFKHPNEKRAQALHELMNPFGIKINDVNLFHQAFLFGTMKDHSVIPHTKTCKPLEFIGHEVLIYCTKQNLANKNPNLTDKELEKEAENFVHHINIAKISKELKLKENFAMNIDEDLGIRKHVSMFKGLLGAIFIDGKEDGLKNAQIFVDKILEEFNTTEQAQTFAKPQGKIVLGQLPKEMILSMNDSKNPVYEAAPVAWKFSNKPKKKLVYDTLKQYNLKLKPQTLEYVFDINSLSQDKFQKYETIGLQAYNLYLKTLLFKHYPYKTEGDFTQIISAGVKKQEAAILATLFDGGLFTNVGATAKKAHSRYFHALLGAIIEEGGKQGHKNFNDFMKKHAQPIVISTMPKAPKNHIEEFYENFKRAGYNPKELYIEIQDEDSKFSVKIYYQNRLICPEFTANNAEEGRNKAYKTIQKIIRNGDIFENEIKDTPKPKDKRKAQGERLELLQELGDDWGLEFNNYSLLNRAFLDKKSQDIAISHHENYQLLEYVGDAVLNYCVNRMLIERYKNASKGEISNRYIDFSKNDSLARISKQMNLREYLATERKSTNSKFDADLFEAFIGALYLDAGQDGLDKAYDFLYENFSNIICPIRR